MVGRTQYKLVRIYFTGTCTYRYILDTVSDCNITIEYKYSKAYSTSGGTSTGLVSVDCTTGYVQYLYYTLYLYSQYLYGTDYHRSWDEMSVTSSVVDFLTSTVELRTQYFLYSFSTTVAKALLYWVETAVRRIPVLSTSTGTLQVQVVSQTRTVLSTEYSTYVVYLYRTETQRQKV